MSVHKLQAIERRPSAAPAPLRPCTVREQPCADPWDTTGRARWLEWYAYDAFTGARVARSLYRDTLDEQIAGRGYYEVPEIDGDLPPEPRICVFPPRTLRWEMAAVIGGYGYAAVDIATGAAFADSWHPTVLRDAVAKWFPHACEAEAAPCS